jgi:L-malate glycosyltransferase
MSVLFVGNILSKHRGTLGPSEKITTLLSSKYPIKAVSDKASQIRRLFDIIWVCLTHKYTLLIADTYSGNAFNIARIASIIAKLRGKKLVLVLRGGRLPEMYGQEKAKVRAVLNRADRILSPSLFIINYLKPEGYNVEYYPDFIDTDVFVEKPMLRKPYSLLWVRAFKHIYNPQIAVKALHLVTQKFPQATLTMVGPDDGLLGEVKKLAADLGILDKIEFVGRVENKSLPEYYSSHSVYLNTTSYESFGIAVMEAAACGIPIISNKVGEIPLIWDNGGDILIVDQLNEALIAEKVMDLFENPAKAEQIAGKAKQKALKFSWIEVKAKWEELFSA